MNEVSDIFTINFRQKDCQITPADCLIHYMIQNGLMDFLRKQYLIVVSKPFASLILSHQAIFLKMVISKSRHRMKHADDIRFKGWPHGVALLILGKIIISPNIIRLNGFNFLFYPLPDTTLGIIIKSGLDTLL